MSTDDEAKAKRARAIRQQIETLKGTRATQPPMQEVPAPAPAPAPADKAETPADFVQRRTRELGSGGKK